MKRVTIKITGYDGYNEFISITAPEGYKVRGNKIYTFDEPIPFKNLAKCHDSVLVEFESEKFGRIYRVAKCDKGKVVLEFVKNTTVKNKEKKKSLHLMLVKTGSI